MTDLPSGSSIRDDEPPRAPTEREDAVAAVEESLGTLVRRVRASWKDAAAAIDPGLQPVGYKILSSLVHTGPTHSGALADILAVDKSVMSRQVRVLEDLSLVISTPDPADGRARILAATPLAVQRLREERSLKHALLQERLSDWTAEELSVLAKLLDRLTKPPA